MLLINHVFHRDWVVDGVEAIMEGDLALSENTSDLVHKLLLPPVGIRVFLRHLSGIYLVSSFPGLSQDFLCFALLLVFLGFTVSVFLVHERDHMRESHLKVVKLDQIIFEAHRLT